VGQVLIGVEHAPISVNDLYLIQVVYPVSPSLPSVVGNEGWDECWLLAQSECGKVMFDAAGAI
jgi:hypothetical protein